MHKGISYNGGWGNGQGESLGITNLSVFVSRACGIVVELFWFLGWFFISSLIIFMATINH